MTQNVSDSKIKTRSTRRNMLKIAAGVGVVSTLGSTSVVAENDTYGTDDTINIANWNDLNAIRDDIDTDEPVDVDYVLIENLDADTTGYDEHVGDVEGGWEPIESGPFASFTFDGNGNEIKNLIINRPDQNGIGLFASLSNAIIKNVLLEDVDIVGNGTYSDPVGGLAGDSDGDVKMKNISVSGNVVATNGNRVGLLVGDTDSTDTITGCKTSGSVSGSRRVGGLVGRLDGGAEIRDCHSSANVSAIEDPADDTGRFGGLVGDIQSNALVCDSSATGDVYAISDGGGFAGSVYGRLRRCYATGDVTSDGWAGGLATTVTGTFDDDAIIEQSFATGSVSSEGTSGGLLGWIGDKATVRESYAATTTTGDLDAGLIGNIGEEIEVDNVYWDTTVSDITDSMVGIGLETIDMQGNSAVENLNGFDFAETWEITTDPDGYPTLKNVSEPEEPEEPDDGLIDAPGDVEIPSEYAENDGSVGPSGLLDAGTDFENGKADFDTLLDVGTAFQNS